MLNHNRFLWTLFLPFFWAPSISEMFKHQFVYPPLEQSTGPEASIFNSFFIQWLTLAFVLMVQGFTFWIISQVTSQPLTNNWPEIISTDLLFNMFIKWTHNDSTKTGCRADTPILKNLPWLETHIPKPKLNLIKKPLVTPISRLK